MSDHDCGCDCKKIIVQCGPGSGGVPTPPPTTRYSCINGQCVPDPNGAYASLGACLEACQVTPPPPQTRYSCINGQCVPDPNGAYVSLGACLEACRLTPPPPPQQRCGRVLVIIHNVQVTSDGESGDAEWTLNFNVNGQVQSWTNDVNDEDPPYDIGFTFIVPLPDVASTVRVGIGGTEEDDTSATDALPTLARTHGIGDNWGIGFHSGSASDDEFAYTVSYEIQCVDFTTNAIVSMNELVTRVRRLAEEHESKRKQDRVRELSDSQILTIHLKKLAKKGWLLKQVSGDLLIFEGHGAKGSPMDNFRPLREKQPKAK